MLVREHNPSCPRCPMLALGIALVVPHVAWVVSTRGVVQESEPIVGLKTHFDVWIQKTAIITWLVSSSSEPSGIPTNADLSPAEYQAAPQPLPRAWGQQGVSIGPPLHAASPLITRPAGRTARSFSGQLLSSVSVAAVIEDDIPSIVVQFGLHLILPRSYLQQDGRTSSRCTARGQLRGVQRTTLVAMATLLCHLVILNKPSMMQSFRPKMFVQD